MTGTDEVAAAQAKADKLEKKLARAQKKARKLAERSDGLLAGMLVEVVKGPHAGKHGRLERVWTERYARVRFADQTHTDIVSDRVVASPLPVEADGTVKDPQSGAVIATLESE